MQLGHAVLSCPTGQMHSVYLWDKKKDRFRDNPVKLYNSNGFIAVINPPNFRDVPPPVVTADAADFDGDGLVDLLTHSGSQGSRILTVHWMALSNATLSASKTPISLGSTRHYVHCVLSQLQPVCLRLPPALTVLTHWCSSESVVCLVLQLPLQLPPPSPSATTATTFQTSSWLAVKA